MTEPSPPAAGSLFRDSKIGPATARRFFLLAFAAMLFASCGGQLSPFRRGAGTTTVHVDQSDAEILRITENARSTVNIFFRHLNSPEASERNFFVKYAFEVNGESDVSAEQVWISGVAFRNGRYYGTVASTPIYLTDISRGDRVNFCADSITDWMFTRDGRIVGGYSIRHLLEQIPEEERTDSQRRTLQMFE